MGARSHLTILALIIGALISPLVAQTVMAKDGNICFASVPAQPCKRLTASGLDREPDLSTDRQLVVFVRGTPHDSIVGPTGYVETTELWVVSVTSGQGRRLVRGGDARVPNNVPIGLFKSPQFSPNGARVYFMSSASVVSGAVYVVDLASRSLQEICPGNSLVVVKHGPYAGDLVVEQHRYFANGGSYDWTYVLSPDGKEIGPLGDPSVPGFDI